MVLPWPPTTSHVMYLLIGVVLAVILTDGIKRWQKMRRNSQVAHDIRMYSARLSSIRDRIRLVRVISEDAHRELRQLREQSEEARKQLESASDKYQGARDTAKRIQDYCEAAEHARAIQQLSNQTGFDALAKILNLLSRLRSSNNKATEELEQDLPFCFDDKEQHVLSVAYRRFGDLWVHRRKELIEELAKVSDTAEGFKPVRILLERSGCFKKILPFQWNASLIREMKELDKTKELHTWMFNGVHVDDNLFQALYPVLEDEILATYLCLLGLEHHQTNTG